MNDTSNSNSKKFGTIALVFFITGIILPALITTIAVAFFNKEIFRALNNTIILMGACELLALVFGVLGWKEKRAKIATIGSGILVSLLTILIIRFFIMKPFWVEKHRVEYVNQVIQDLARFPEPWQTGDIHIGTVKDMASEVVKRLEDDNAQVRAAALIILGNIDAKETEPEVRKGLKDNDARVRATAVAALGLLEAKDAAPEIVKRMDDDDARVRATAVDTLGLLEAKDAVPEIVKRLKDDDARVRTAAVDTLGLLEAKEMAPEISKMLKDDDETVRKAAWRVLEEWGIEPEK